MIGAQIWTAALDSYGSLRAGRFRAAVGVLLLLMTLLRGAAIRADSDREAKSTDLAALIEKIRANESLFENLDATVKFSRTFSPETLENQATASFGPSVLKATEEVDRVSARGSRYFFSGEEVLSFSSGDRVTRRRMATFDGTQTVAIEGDNSATVFRRRYEPAQVFPPLCWGIFTLEVNFPLSVYLQGTAAIKAHPKTRRFPTETGSVFEFAKVEAERMGEEKLDNFDCVKVKVRRWYYADDTPSTQILWLAKDRNYHVARCQTSTLRNGKDQPGDETRVTNWRKIAEGVWLPAVVTSETFRTNRDGTKSDAIWFTRRLTLDKAAVGPVLPAVGFQLPHIPGSLPKFVIGADGQLDDSPQHLAPARADAATTLDTILTRLAAEEAKYDRLEVATTNRYRMLGIDALPTAGMYTTDQTSERSVIVGNRLFYSEEHRTQLASGDSSSQTTRQAYDGRWVRGFSRFVPRANDPKAQLWATLSLHGPEDMQLLRAHTTVFRGDRNRQSLSASLRSGWFDIHNKYKMTVEYVGDEQAGGLHCHKIKCTLPEKRRRGDNSFLVWLARDRNLIAVRHEWHEPARSDKLPTGINFVDDLREIGPGIWFPYRTVQFAFQSWGGLGLCENRPLLQWRRDIEVTSLKRNPMVDEKLFNEVEVPTGTTIQVRDEEGTYLGQVSHSKTGNINVGPEALLELRVKARVDKAEADRRQKALDALIGQKAPLLPQETWLNSGPLSWRQLAGKVVVVDFWATWCGPCKPDLDRLAELHKAWKLSGVTNLALLGVHSAGTKPDTIRKAVADKKLGYPIVIDSPPNRGHAAWGDLFDQFAVRQIPMTFVVDASGTIVAHGRLEEMLSKAGQLAAEKQTTNK